MTLLDRAGIHWKLFLILLAASILANIAVLPYASSLGLLCTKELPIPFPIALLVLIIQAVLFSSIAIFIGLFLGKKVGLGAPIIEGWLKVEPTITGLKSILKISAFLGVLVGVSIFILDRFVFAIFVDPITPFQATPPLIQRILASFYGGICEEVVMRLFAMTLIVWVSYKIKRTKDNTPTNLGLWLAIILVSLVFGLGHIPMTAAFMKITPIVVIRALVLNSIAGTVFGWLYWKKGLESAMVSHFSTDIILHVILPLLY
ncbi:MAG: CPBP family intramembrane glutamic endopeptidase [Planctomycetota bacterium]|jgi:membrane protease YdiL (CAAX protease family)